MQNAKLKEEPDYLKGPDTVPQKFYISFGQAHAHRIGDYTYDANSLMLVVGQDEIDVRLFVSRITNGKWCGTYPERQFNEIKDYFPRGVLNTDEPLEAPRRVESETSNSL